MSDTTTPRRRKRGAKAPPRPVPPVPYVPKDRRTCIGLVCMGLKTFLSEGPHHRVCGKCREVAVQRKRRYSPIAFSPAADMKF